MAAFMGVEQGFGVVSLFVPKILSENAILAAIGFNLGILWSERDKDPNHFYGCRMSAFMGVQHGSRAASHFVSKSMAQIVHFWI